MSSNNDDEMLEDNIDENFSRLKLNCNELLDKNQTDFEIVSSNGRCQNAVDLNSILLNENETTSSYGNELKRMYGLLTENSFVANVSDDFVHKMRSDFEKYKQFMVDISPL